MSDDLVAFLRARLAEDAVEAEEAAEKVGDGHWEQRNVRIVTTADRDREVADYAITECIWHIVRHDPAHVLAEVAAKRRIVDEHRAIMGPGWCSTCDIPGDVKGNVHGCQTLRLLAAPYAAVEGYRPEWAPND